MVAPVTALVTLCSIILISVLFKGIIGRLSILLGVGIGYITAVIRGEVDFSKIDKAVETQGIVGLPQFQTPRVPLGARRPIHPRDSGARG